MSEIDYDALAEELAEFAPKQAAEAAHTPREERLLAGLAEIGRFVEAHGRRPENSSDRDIFERLYAVRLQALGAKADCRAFLGAHDRLGLLGGVAGGAATALDVDALAAELAGLDTDIRTLHHVRSAGDRRAAEEIATRTPCADFERFQPLFAAVHEELATGRRITRPFGQKAEIRPGAFFIVGGQTAYVAARDKPTLNEHGVYDARLRVVYDNGTESNLLMRSLQKALTQDEAGRSISDPDAGPLFAADAADPAKSGTIYILRSRSSHPFIAEHREVVHKIGVTAGKVETRIAGAETSATYLLAPVEIVATYEVFGVNCQKLEALLHRLFGAAQIDIQIPDRFGNIVKPREWFLLPLAVIDEAVEHVRDGTISQYRYEPKDGRLIRIKEARQAT